MIKVRHKSYIKDHVMEKGLQGDYRYNVIKIYFGVNHGSCFECIACNYFYLPSISITHVIEWFIFLLSVTFLLKNWVLYSRFLSPSVKILTSKSAYTQFFVLYLTWLDINIILMWCMVLLFLCSWMTLIILLFHDYF